MTIYTEESLIKKLREIKAMGWVKNRRHGNVGGVGNTIEDLLEIAENNFQTPDAGEWELKCQRMASSSLTTLLHMEPEPRDSRIVPRILLPLYGWAHAEAGNKYGANEMSFRQTIHGAGRSDRGFKVLLNRELERIEVSFDARYVDSRHSLWLASVERKVGLNELSPIPFWTVENISKKVQTKLKNCCYVQAQTKVINGEEYFSYEKITLYQGFNLYGFLSLLESGDAYIDFDARTGHNHGTKIRIKSQRLPEIYSSITAIQ